MSKPILITVYTISVLLAVDSILNTVCFEAVFNISLQK